MEREDAKEPSQHNEERLQQGEGFIGNSLNVSTVALHRDELQISTEVSRILRKEEREMVASQPSISHLHICKRINSPV